MAIQWMDNFSQYGTGTSYMLNGLYAEIESGGVSCAADPDGVSSGSVLRGNLGPGVRRVLSGAKTTVGVGLRVWLTSLPSSSSGYGFLSFRDAGNSYQVSIGISTTGVIEARRGAYNGTLLGSSSSPVIVAGVWNHIEVKVLFSQTVGTVEVRVNETAVLTLTGLDTCATANVECSQIATTSGISASAAVYMKDLICWDSSGSDNNDFIGDVQIVTLEPNGDDSFPWAASTGSVGYSLIDEATPNDVDYITADASPPAAAVFTLTDLDGDVVSVKGLQTVARLNKSDGGTATVQVGLKSGSDTDEGTDRPVTTSASFWFDISEQDPATSAAWTPTAVNSAKLKINRTT